MDAQVLQQLHPQLLEFYRDEHSRRGLMNNLRIGSLAAVWLLAILGLMIVFMWFTGENVWKILNFLWVVLIVFATLRAYHYWIYRKERLRLRMHKKNVDSSCNET